MTLGALSIVFQEYAWLSIGLFGLQLLGFEALMHIPRVVAAPHNRLAWMVATRDLFFSLGALSFAATQSQEWRTKGTHWLISVARVLMGMVLIFFALEDFLHPELAPGVPLRQRTPTALPWHLLWGYLSGVAFVLVGVCLIINKKAGLAAAWIGTLVFFFTVIVYLPIMVQHNFDVGTGLNPQVDVLLFSGAALCLAGSLRKPLEARTEQDEHDGSSVAALSPEHQSNEAIELERRTHFPTQPKY